MNKNIKESQTDRSIGEGVKDARSEDNIFTSVDAIYEERKRRKEAFRVFHEEATESKMVWRMITNRLLWSLIMMPREMQGISMN